VSEADRSLSEVAALIRSLYGTLPHPPSGVIHTVAAVRCAPGRFHVIKIEDGAPRSSTDRFVLDLWRAHCDALIVTGQILRSEPTLSYVPTGRLSAGLTGYRARVLGKTRPLRGAILTRSADLPRDHPVFRERAVIEFVVLTEPQQVRALQQTLGGAAEVVGVPELDARAALAFLRSEGAETIGVEAGPSVASILYSPPALVDHLMLSICDAPVAARVVGGALPEDAALFAGLTCVSEVSRLEESGTWRFQHWQSTTAVSSSGDPR
jgi:riboflavin biosynthesis pyrimidine reductase